MNKAAPLLEVKNLTKYFGSDHKRVEILNGIDLTIERGESLAIQGPSGVGKSTLLHIMGTLEKPSSGQVLYKGVDLFRWDDKRLSEFRNRTLGFIFQFHHLLQEFSAKENTMMPGLIRGYSVKEASKKATEVLEMVGLGDRIDHKVAKLSGGEHQKVAVARALILKPDIILADEPTGNLDVDNGEEIFNLLFSLSESEGITLIMVTHNPELAMRLPRKLHLLNGKIVLDVVC